MGDATAKSYASGKLQLVEELGSVLRSPYGARLLQCLLRMLCVLSGKRRGLAVQGRWEG